MLQWFDPLHFQWLLISCVHPVAILYVVVQVHSIHFHIVGKVNPAATVVAKYIPLQELFQTVFTMIIIGEVDTCMLSDKHLTF